VYIRISFIHTDVAILVEIDPSENCLAYNFPVAGRIYDYATLDLFIGP
jgi:hypothetical protein